MKPLKKEAKVAIGASITVVILVLIAVIVIVAVSRANNITQMFGTVFTNVDDTVRDNKYIASIDNEYVLMDGDKIVVGKFTHLTYNAELDGYVFAEENGDSGVLDANGKEIYRFSYSEINLRQAEMFSGNIVSVRKSGTVINYNLNTKERVTALDGLLSQTISNNGNYFSAYDGHYAIISVSGGKINKLTLSSGKEIERVSPEQENIFNTLDTASQLLLSDGKNFIIGSKGTKKVIYADESGSVHVADFAKAKVSAAKNQEIYYSIDGKIFNSKFVDSGIAGQQNVLYSKDSFLCNGENVYSYDGSKLTLEHADAILTSVSEHVTFIVKEQSIVYDLKGKEITRTSGDNKIQRIYESGLLEGSILRNFKGNKQIEGVTEIYNNINFDYEKDIVAKKDDGTVHSLNRGEIYSAEQVAAFGGVGFESDTEAVLQFNSGYLTRNPLGYYNSVSGEQIKNTDISGLSAVGLASDRDAYAVFYYDRLTVYKFGKNMETVTTLYYNNIAAVSNHKNGLIYKADEDGTKYGFVNLSGKVIAAPIYKNIEYTEGYLVIEIVSAPVKGILSFSGKAVTSFNLKSITPIGDYGYVLKADGNYSVIDSRGREVLKDVTALSELTVLESKFGEYQETDDYKYFKVCEPAGWHVIKTAMATY